MSEVVIKVENVSKQYRLGQVSSKTLSGDLKRWWYKTRGKEDPFLKIGEVNDRTKSGLSEYVWALKDINFEVRQGEVLGIIGKNGAGKSTLLKLLSRVTTPTTGAMSIKGRLAALLEVGTGFHPELTGRENVFLNGAIMGMNKAEIKSKFDEIVDFAGVERYIDTPVKRYSSGMHVRLGFAVAAHLEPEILIVDEVLAVGDVEFQRKCLGKMKSVSGEGRTVLFVSHNMGAVKTLCSRGILLEDGVVKTEGTVDEIVNHYIQSNIVQSSNGRAIIDDNGITGTGEARIYFVELINELNEYSDIILFKESIKLNIHVDSKINLESLAVDIKILDKNANSLFYIQSIMSGYKLELKKGKNYFSVEIPNFLLPGVFYLSIGIHNSSTYMTIDQHEEVLRFVVDSAARDASNSYRSQWVHASSLIEGKWSMMNN
ncbi:MAG: ABC transporter ATP-binding protein [Bacteroidetes bacterium]|nr:ABC transporter ATP-binding protein [Bacteroidota bacterium]